MSNYSDIQPRFETISKKQLLGLHTQMSLANNKTHELWKGFMPLLFEIKNKVSEDLFSVNIFDRNYYKKFSPANEFIKWAAVEVTNYDKAPKGTEKLILPGGLYAVFHYKGSSADKSIFQYIYGEWLPASGYVLDDRPHFEILGRNYKNNDPGSEEDIYIPVKKAGALHTVKLEKDINVFYVTASSFPAGIMEAHQKLQSIVPFSRERRMFGISRPENGQIIYRAGAEELVEGEGKQFGCETLLLKKGNYIEKTVYDYPKYIDAIGNVFGELLKNPGIDLQGYCIEWYLNSNDVRCMVRLKD